MNKIKTFFNLDRPYEFDPTDLTALIYTICAIGGMMGANMTILWCIGASIGTAFCWEARKANNHCSKRNSKHGRNLEKWRAYACLCGWKFAFCCCM